MVFLRSMAPSNYFTIFFLFFFFKVTTLPGFFPYRKYKNQLKTVEFLLLEWRIRMASIDVVLSPMTSSSHWPVWLKLKHFWDKLLSFNLIRRMITAHCLFLKVLEEPKWGATTSLTPNTEVLSMYCKITCKNK